MGSNPVGITNYKNKGLARNRWPFFISGFNISPQHSPQPAILFYTVIDGDRLQVAAYRHTRYYRGFLDLTLFDPVKVADRSTYKAGEQGLPPVGIPYVIVNGTTVLKNGQVLDANPGQPIRYPVEQKGRFEPVEVNKWLDDHAIKTPGVLNFDDTGATKVIEKE